MQRSSSQKDPLPLTFEGQEIVLGGKNYQNMSHEGREERLTSS